MSKQPARLDERIFPAEAALQKPFDYIVIGNGSAGTVIASRLTENPEVLVLLVKAGSAQQSITIDMPALLFVITHRATYNRELQPCCDLVSGRASI